MGEIMNSPKGVTSCVPERVSLSCPTYGTRHDPLHNWKPGMCHSWCTNRSTYVTEKCQICEQGLYDYNNISEYAISEETNSISSYK